MELIDEVLASKKRIRLVLAARATPKTELLVAAAVRAVENGQQVLYIGPTSHGLTYDQHMVFPPEWIMRNQSGITFMSADIFDNNLDFGEHGRQWAEHAVLPMRPDLIIMRDPFLIKHSGETARIIAAIMQASGARLLIATLPITRMGKPLASNRIYRLWRQSFVIDEIDVWHWPSPSYYRALLGYFFSAPMFDQELGAKWVHEPTHTDHQDGDS